jgi:hypothetical protein
MMIPSAFVQKWAASRGAERATAQEHFIDLCRLLNEQTPNEADPNGHFYAFEKGAKTLDGDGFADVWLKGHFAWEYKGKHKDLQAAYRQVQTYREALGNPPLLVVCDMDQFEIHTNWTNTEKWIYRFRNADIVSDAKVEVSTVSAPAEDAPRLTALQVLQALFEDPHRLKPQKTTDQITQDAARMFGRISDELRKWKVDDMRIARFVTRVLFCMFATDVGLLPRETFSEIIAVHKKSGDDKAFRKHLAELFSVMNTGGPLWLYEIPYFDGRLFEDNDVPVEIGTQEVMVLAELDALNWADVEPSIFGTLFERVLDPKKKKMLGAHYTSRADIELIVEPVLMAPLRREWEEVQAAVEAYLNRPETHRAKEETQRARVRSLLGRFHERLATIRILDPACGSGNFLYVSLALLKALEKEVVAFAAVHGVDGMVPRVHPRQLFGIETNAFAHELASIVIWIGYLQWKHRNVMPLDDEEPILELLDQVEGKDAILDLSAPDHPCEAAWPKVDVVVGNPPFLGGKRLRKELGDEYVDGLFSVWDRRVARESDLCCYWFEQGRAAIDSGRAKRVGLLATQAIRGGANRRVLQRIKESGDIFYAQADRKWIQDGVAVRVSMVGFDDGSETRRLLNESKDDAPEHALARARPVEGINANLTSQVAASNARRLKENLGISFMGITKVGPFDISPSVAQRLLHSANPDGRNNADVVRPWVHGRDLNQRRREWWVIDFPPGTPLEQAALYEQPFEYVNEHVKPERVKNKGQSYATKWWIHAEPRPAMRSALAGLQRYLATSMVSKHRLFSWLPAGTLAENLVIVFAREDDYFFGVLHCRAHEVWARATGTQLREAESGFRYTPTTCFETFPFPQPTPYHEAAIAAAAEELNRLREGWLNPAPVGGLGLSESELKKRTLTNLYNQRPTWLVNAHAVLDAAVFDAYGWSHEIPDSEILARLLELNLQREPA